MTPLSPRHLQYIAARDAYVAEFGKWPTMAEVGRRMGISRTRAAQIAYRIVRWEKWNKGAPLRAREAERNLKRRYMEQVCELIGQAAQQHAKARRLRDDRVAWLEQRQAEITAELAGFRKQRRLRTTLDIAAREKKRLATRQIHQRQVREVDHNDHVRARQWWIYEQLNAISRQREAAWRARQDAENREHAELHAAGLATPIRFVHDKIFTIQPDGFWYPRPWLRVEPVE